MRLPSSLILHTSLPQRINARRTAALLVFLLSAVSCSDAETNDDAGSGGQGGSEPSEPSPEDPTSCSFGDDEEKCSGDAQLACTPVLEETGMACARDADCEAGALCFEAASDDSSEGECLLVVGQCLAIEEPGDGDAFGSSCELGSTTCAGSCVELSETEAECEEYCRVGEAAGCGKEALSGSGIACAYFAFDLSDVDVEQGAGDVGICANLCDCNDDCPGTQRCLDAPTDGFQGICTGGVVLEDSLSCENGLGGAGGAP